MEKKNMENNSKKKDKNLGWYENRMEGSQSR